METAIESRPAAPESAVTRLDALIVGAGISGIGAARYLSAELPDLTYAVVEALDGFGGTWRVHTYPGIRSDSALYTFGYAFKPWRDAPIATADKIQAYLAEVIADANLGRKILYSHKVKSASWSDEEKTWRVEVEAGAGAQTVRKIFIARFLWMCQGYYRHAQGHMPQWPGMKNFTGRIIHAQNGPQDRDVSGKRIVVIGSGATAATLVPAVADQCEHVTCIQRSPTYFFPRPNSDPVIDTLREIGIDDDLIHHIARKKVLHTQKQFIAACKFHPEAAKQELITGVKALLPAGFDVEKHFTPKYAPWRQRVAAVPDGDLFKAVAKGKASVVTGEIDEFTASGVRMKSGETVEADIIVAATGFDMAVLGDIPFFVNGQRVDCSKIVTYRDMMFTGLPNMVWTFGYFRTSWTMRVDLICAFVCRLLKTMREQHKTVVRVEAPPDARRLSWVDLDDFNPGYLLRSEDKLPRRCDAPGWDKVPDYYRDAEEFPAIALDQAPFRFE
jgi:cation diffusion facilitator CzcD-associated flavoprotein CzcO